MIYHSAPILCTRAWLYPCWHKRLLEGYSVGSPTGLDELLYLKPFIGCIHELVTLDHSFPHSSTYLWGLQLHASIASNSGGEDFYYSGRQYLIDCINFRHRRIILGGGPSSIAYCSCSGKDGTVRYRTCSRMISPVAAGAQNLFPQVNYPASMQASKVRNISAERLVCD